MVRYKSLWWFALLAALLPQVRAAAQDGRVDGRFELGVRGLIVLGKGTPANDMVGQSVVGRFALNDAWRLGVSLDNVKFDYETPNRSLGIAATSVVDGLNEWQRIGVFAERRYDGNRLWDWHWLLGIGRASVDDVANVAGQRVGGGTFDIATTADDELHVFAGGGLHRELARRWLLETSLTLEHHDTSYALTDRVSGARGNIGSQSVYGISVGIGYRF
jgi:hypothetical protein